MTYALFALFMALSYLRPFDMFAPEMAVYRPMLILMMLVLMLSMANSKKVGGSILNGQHLRLLWGIVAIVFVSVALAAGFGPAISNGLIAFLPSALTFIIAGLNLGSLDRLKTAGAVIIASLVVLCFFSIACYHTGFMVEMLVVKQHGTGADSGFDAAFEANDIPALDNSGRYLWRIRSVGFLADPNDFGQTLVCFLPVLFALYKPAHFMRNLMFIATPAAIMLYTIYLTRSRGALLGLSALFFFTIRDRLGTVKTAMLVAVIGAAAMAFNFTGGRGYSANEESAGGRVDAWSEGLVMLSHNPLTGVGYHRFGENHSHTAHNTLVVSFGEIGLLGYFMWLGLIVLVFKNLLKAESLALPGSEELIWVQRLKSSFFGFFTCGMFLSRAFEPPIFILLIFCVAAWHAVKVQLKGTPAGDALAAPMPWRSTTVLMMFVTIFAVWAVVVTKTVMVGRSV